MIQPDANGIYHPATETDVIDLIQLANSQQQRIRILSSGDSLRKLLQPVPSDSPADSPIGRTILVQLNLFRKVEINEQNGLLTVGAGINLGFDPYDPSETSEENDANNLYYQLQQKGWAIANVPASLHQSVSGFLVTGSSGGTLQHSFEEAIQSIRLIDGTGKVNTYSRSNNPDNPFFAVLVSLGLLGIITEITLQCVPAFEIRGREDITDVSCSPYQFTSLVNDGRPGLQEFLTKTEYARILWWPYSTLHRVVTWQAKSVTFQPTATENSVTPTKTYQPYQPPFPKIAGLTLPSQFIASSAFQLIATWPNWFYDLTGNPSNEASTLNLDKLKPVIEWIFPYIYPVLTDQFFPLNSPHHPPQEFYDLWLGSLPMDKVEFSNRLFDLEYTELWFPIDKAQQVISVLNQFYTADGYAATGYYCVEIMAGKQTSSWMSPAYRCDSIRVNIKLFRNSAREPRNFFAQFWDLFAENNLPFRLHWSFDLPDPASRAGVNYLKNQYPKWNDFMQLRKEMDPDDLFLTDYWKSQLGIEA